MPKRLIHKVLHLPQTVKLAEKVQLTHHPALKKLIDTGLKHSDKTLSGSRGDGAQKREVFSPEVKGYISDCVVNTKNQYIQTKWVKNPIRITVYAEQMICEIAGLFPPERELSLSKWGKS